MQILHNITVLTYVLLINLKEWKITERNAIRNTTYHQKHSTIQNHDGDNNEGGYVELIKWEYVDLPIAAIAFVYYTKVARPV